MAEQYEMEWIETSAKEDSNIDKVFEKLTEKVLEKIDIEGQAKDSIPIEKHKEHSRQ